MANTFLSRLGKRLGFAEEPKPRVSTKRTSRMSGYGQPQYLANTLDVQRIQNALRAAERGDTWLLFTIFRDMVASYGHLNAEWGKRKLVITGNPETLIPADPNNEDDKIACEVIKQVIEDCENWNMALTHLLDATLYPLAAAEKIFEPVTSSDNSRFKHPLRYRLKEIAPVDPTVLCFKLPYVPSFGEQNDNLRYNPDDWESWLRFYSTSDSGAVNYSVGNTYKPERDKHIIHRGAMLSPVIPPNFGGLLRQILFPWLLSTQGRDWFALLMQKYGQPIIIGKTNSSKKEAVTTMQEAFAMATQMGGIVVDTKDAVEFANVSSSDLAEGHVKYQKWLDSHVSRLVIGSSLSAHAEKTGMGSGASAQSEEIREDIRKNDTINLSNTLRRQLFKQILLINGYRGNPPHIRWGGMRAGEASTFADTLATMSSGGYELDDIGLRSANENFGFTFRRKPEADIADATPGRQVNRQEKSNPNKVKY
jgi:phage gp29-like protein